MDDDLTYSPENFQASVMRIRWFNVKTDKYDDAREIFERVFEVYRQNNFDIGLHLFWNQTPDADGPHLAILWQHTDWASMDKNREWVAKYEAVHGKDSWSEYFRDQSEAVEFQGTQLNVLNSELSTPSPDN